MELDGCSIPKSEELLSKAVHVSFDQGPQLDLEHPKSLERIDDLLGVGDSLGDVGEAIEHGHDATNAQPAPALVIRGSCSPHHIRAPTEGQREMPLVVRAGGWARHSPVSATKAQ